MFNNNKLFSKLKDETVKNHSSGISIKFTDLSVLHHTAGKPIKKKSVSTQIKLGNPTHSALYHYDLKQTHTFDNIEI